MFSFIGSQLLERALNLIGFFSIHVVFLISSHFVIICKLSLVVLMDLDSFWFIANGIEKKRFSKSRDDIYFIPTNTSWLIRDRHQWCIITKILQFQSFFNRFLVSIKTQCDRIRLQFGWILVILKLDRTESLSLYMSNVEINK